MIVKVLMANLVIAQQEENRSTNLVCCARHWGSVALWRKPEVLMNRLTIYYRYRGYWKMVRILVVCG